MGSAIKQRDPSEKADKDEPRIEFALNGLAAACVEIDNGWVNLETLKRRRCGRSGWSYTVRLPVLDAKHMLDDLITRGNQSGSEGHDQELGAKYACRRAAVVLSKELGKPPPRWWRG